MNNDNGRKNLAMHVWDYEDINKPFGVPKKVMKNVIIGGWKSETEPELWQIIVGR